ncbi:hypothetical protein PROFUN_13296 [Planoprotostelium fungivorum]|uniref:Uncharacterized protein n=1 Tax=Planoprotostelium fungivorum TaxID=1890364 RepID=A0A2P6N4N2_9EUKA|nr:hypothetical protein PROFUN_13296 [Planoprotostelium fungivorum]
MFAYLTSSAWDHMRSLWTKLTIYVEGLIPSPPTFHQEYKDYHWEAHQGTPLTVFLDPFDRWTAIQCCWYDHSE